MKKIIKFLTHDVWTITETELSKWKILFVRVVRIIILSIRGFFNNTLNIKASALAYSLLFAMVPIIALIIAIAKGFGFEELIEDSLNASSLGGTDVIPILMGFVEKYLETSRGGVFLGIGILILLFSVYMFFLQAENSFNAIWQVKKSRSLARQFTTYFSILFAMPVLVVLSSGLSIFLSTTLSKLELLSPFITILVKVLPLIIVWIIFTLIYVIIPNTKVKLSCAAISGAIAGTAFQLFQFLYVWGQVYLSRYNAVYGSFAALPFLLVWLQGSALIILIGAEITYLMQNIRNFDYEVDTENISRRYEDYICLYLMYLTIKRFENNEPALSVKTIIENNHLPIRLVTRLLNRLVDSGLLIEIYLENTDAKAYQPACDINIITLGFYNNRLESCGSELFIKNINDEMVKFWDKSLSIKKEIEKNADDILIKDYFFTENKILNN